MKNPYLKELYQRFYLLSVFYFATNIMKEFVEIENVYIHLIAIGGSQLILFFVCMKSKDIATEEFLSKGETANLTFLLMSYIFSKTYNENNEISIDKLLERNNRVNGDEPQSAVPERNISEDTFNSAKKLINMI